MMVDTATRAARYEDLFDLPENQVGEILNGVIHSHPRPAPKHSRASSSLGGQLGGVYDWISDGSGGWWILDEPELHFDTDVMVPDIAGWRREKMPELPETAWFELEPDWVCEILSPSTARADRIIKMPLYANAGISHIWLVDPDLQTLEVYALSSDGHWKLIAMLKDSDVVNQPPFDTMEFSLGLLWS